MAEIIFESDHGVVIEKTAYKNGRCKVAVKNKDGGGNHMIYRYKNTPGLESQYISWENLNHCGGWNSSDTYLQTAVQRGKKLYAGFTITYSDAVGFDSMSTSIAILKGNLPDDCIFGDEKPSDTTNGPYTFRHFYVCKTGSISDYIDLDDVVAVYGWMGIHLTVGDVNKIQERCTVPLERFADRTARFDYANANSGIELVVCGLLLGYPLESTAWLIERDGLLPVKK